MLRDMNMTCKELFFGWECLHREGNEAIYRRRTSSVFFYAAVYVLVLALVRNLAASFLLGLCMAFFLSLTFLFVFFLYGGIIAKTKKLMTLRKDGWLAKIYSGQWRLYIVCFIVALVVALLMVIRLIDMPYEYFVVMSISLLAMPLSYKFFTKIISSESIPWLVYSRFRPWISLGMTACTIILQSIAILSGWITVPHYDTLDAALSASSVTLTKSNIINIVLNFSHYITSIEFYFISKFQNESVIYYPLVFIFSCISCYPIFAIFTLIFLPGSEIRRLFINQYPQTTLTPPCEAGKIFFSSFIFFILFALSFFTFAQFDSNLTEVTPEKYMQPALEIVYKIDEICYKKEIYDNIEKARSSFFAEHQKLANKYAKEKYELCGRMRANVDDFLDWYYSLTSEYIRIANILIGNGSEYISQKLNEYLQRGIQYNNIDSIEHEMKLLDEKYKQEISALADKYKITEKETEGKKIITLEPDFLKVPQINFNDRIRISAGAGGVGFITGVIAAKAMSKPAVKSAAAALVKLAASKAATGGSAAAAGAGIGAAIGSVIPGAGTAVGAAIGGVIGGVSVWIATDAAILSLDEFVNRDAVRKEILEEIDAVCQ